MRRYSQVATLSTHVESSFSYLCVNEFRIVFNDPSAPDKHGTLSEFIFPVSLRHHLSYFSCGVKICNTLVADNSSDQPKEASTIAVGVYKIISIFVFR